MIKAVGTAAERQGQQQRIQKSWAPVFNSGQLSRQGLIFTKGWENAKLFSCQTADQLKLCMEQNGTKYTLLRCFRLSSEADRQHSCFTHLNSRAFYFLQSLLLFIPFMTVPNGLNYESLYDMLYHTEHEQELYFATPVNTARTWAHG